ncbi:DUF6456 domain-containing protein [Aquamicrobium sp. LC103]|uniref:DUF6456 domain-containing protein n=1 Tax=Aquamicrobium sp. LC103 TaxID=1120658 RepID=UPI00063ECDDD|nr:DUF6456 domain-containing protein [Aquamicrobium sp. LC103]TKT81212.1 hypothetical protein XW59_004910 [Aquamicrobium sp. LC103]
MQNKAIIRALRFLSMGPARVGEAGLPGRLLLDAGDRGSISLDTETLDEMCGRELVEVRASQIERTEIGAGLLKRVLTGKEAFQAQHRELGERLIERDAVWEKVTVNDTESPLALLARRRDRDGRKFLSAREFMAGERLRSDYTRGQLMPRMGANWQATVSSGPRGGNDNGIAELTDAALAARQRVNCALEAVGPELSGVLVDICCFLKGLETVESERGWPVRSAKIVLKSALGALARHYEPAGGERQRPHAILHWGAENYRPTLV